MGMGKARHAKKRRCRKGLIWLLALALLLGSGGAAWYYRSDIRQWLFPPSPVETCTELTAPAGVTAELVHIASDGEVLKLDYIQPGLDTYSLYTVIRSLQSGRILSKTDCGTADFSTGLITGGYYVAESDQRQVRFYTHKGALQSTHTLPYTPETGMVAVTPDGRYICYGALGTGGAAQLYLLDVETGKNTAVCALSGYTVFTDARDGQFYLQHNQNTLWVIDAATATRREVMTEHTLRLANAYGCVSQTDSGYTVYSTAGEAADTIPVNCIGEGALSLSMERLLTVVTTDEGDQLTIYTRQDGSYTTYAFPQAIRSAVDLQNGYAAVTTGETEKAVHVYLLNLKALPVSQSGAGTTATTAPVRQEEALVSGTVTAKTLLTDVPILSQFPDYPTGCESVSAVIAMRYAGSDITVDTFIDRYLDKSNDFYTKDGVSYGPDPYEHFLGFPRSVNAYGCMAPVIENAMNAYYQGKKEVVNATGTELSALCSRYIDRSIPCLVWVTIGMAEPFYTNRWTLPGGDTYRWLANEHCMVLVGYDADYYYFSDPYAGALVKYARQLSNERYTAFGKQALAILP